MENDEVKQAKTALLGVTAIAVIAMLSWAYTFNNAKNDCEALGQIGTTRTEFSIVQGCTINLKGIMVPVSKMPAYRN